MNIKAGKEMQAAEHQINLKLQTLTGKVNDLIQDRKMLISCLEDMRNSLSKNHDLKINDLICKINIALMAINHNTGDTVNYGRRKTNTSGVNDSTHYRCCKQKITDIAGRGWDIVPAISPEKMNPENRVIPIYSQTLDFKQKTCYK